MIVPHASNLKNVATQNNASYANFVPREFDGPPIVNSSVYEIGHCLDG